MRGSGRHCSSRGAKPPRAITLSGGKRSQRRRRLPRTGAKSQVIARKRPILHFRFLPSLNAADEAEDLRLSLILSAAAAAATILPSRRRQPLSLHCGGIRLNALSGQINVILQCGPRGREGRREEVERERERERAVGGVSRIAAARRNDGACPTVARPPSLPLPPCILLPQTRYQQ